VDNAVDFIDLSLFLPIGPISVDDVTVILDGRTRNLSSTKVAGFDLALSYDRPTSIGDLSFFTNATILTEYTQQVTSLTPVDDILDTFNNPLDFRLRSGISWRTRPVLASIFVNHTGSYLDDEATNPVTIDSWTTVDASVRFDLAEIIGSPVFSNSSASFSVMNIFNQDPPSLGDSPVRGVVYDSANADPRGRSIGLLLTKKF